MGVARGLGFGQSPGPMSRVLSVLAASGSAGNVFGLMFLAALCGLPAVTVRASGKRSAVPQHIPIAVTKVQVGTASWHRGPNNTASGHRWQPEELVAAHRTLPLGSAVRVVNLRNDRATVVRITDRGPYTKGRIIDLSVAAARQIGCLEGGIAQVRVEVITPDFAGSNPAPKATAPRPGPARAPSRLALTGANTDW